ncbi:MAG: GMC family oxidoreductase [Bacteroidales bacterium]
MITSEIKNEYDYVIVGSGFGGSVSALRLSEKGYKVLVIEKGRYYRQNDFPKTNWNLKRWLWLPSMRFFGFFKLTFFRHIGILSGVGIGGGSLVYANTLPRPKPTFFNSGNWAGIRDWEKELEPFYRVAEKMLGANQNPKLFESDHTLKKVAEAFHKEKEFTPTNVAVFFGEPDVNVPDPFFNGKGPDRAGCKFCGACMTGCRFNAKNTLDKNYLYLAWKNGVDIVSEQIVTGITENKSEGQKTTYSIHFKDSTKLIKHKKTVKAGGVILSGGVLGTVRLLLDLKHTSLKNLSSQVGNHIRTNNESLVLVTSTNKQKDYSEGVAIGSIFPVDDDSHLEPVRYGKGSGFWKLLGAPLTFGNGILVRFFKIAYKYIRYPLVYLRLFTVKDFAKQSLILLFMQHLDSKLNFKRGLINLKSGISEGKAPTAFMPLAKLLAEKTADIMDGKPMVLITEALTGIPTTAHILGGAVIGTSPENGVIDDNHKVFGYENIYVCDGSAISANPGVNPALTITAMTERALSMIPDKKMVIQE